jgi:hypothetical protein
VSLDKSRPRPREIDTQGTLPRGSKQAEAVRRGEANSQQEISGCRRRRRHPHLRHRWPTKRRPLTAIAPPKPINEMTPAEKDKFVGEVVTQIAAAKKKADEGK